MIKKYVADFETQVGVPTFVWCFGITQLYKKDSFVYGSSIEEFIDHISKLGRSDIYFHNLKFDGKFIVDYLLKNNWTIVEDKPCTPKTFSLLVDEVGSWYSISLYFKDNVNIYDSLKKIPLSVEKMAIAYNLPIKKGSIDYFKDRTNHIITNEEIDYVKNDVEIVKYVLEHHFNEGLKKITASSDALFDFKEIISEKNFKKYFPILSPEIDNLIRDGYNGGWTHKKKGVYKVGKGVVIDVNSMYPSIMYNYLLPTGYPMIIQGKPDKEDFENYCYFYEVKLSCTLKKNHLPTIYDKKVGSYRSCNYLEECINLTRVFTQYDLKLILKHYNIISIEYIKTLIFKGEKGLFTPYIDKWYTMKNEANKQGNKPLKSICKLMLNSLYGKFGQSPNNNNRTAVLENNLVKYPVVKHEDRETIYIPVACFITAIGRFIIISSAQLNYKHFCYSDTDSIHLNCDKEQIKLSSLLQLDPEKLGYFDLESQFKQATYLRNKTYALKLIDDSVKICAAGLKEESRAKLKFEDFDFGLVVQGGASKSKTVEGGVIIYENSFQITKNV